MAIYHLDVKTGTRGGGQSASVPSMTTLGARAAMPMAPKSWNTARAATCPPGRRRIPRLLGAADEHERANGRLFQQVEVALPVELDERQRRELAGSFAERLTREERLPYTLAIHRGGAEGSNPHNASGNQ